MYIIGFRPHYLICYIPRWKLIKENIIIVDYKFTKQLNGAEL